MPWPPPHSSSHAEARDARRRRLLPLVLATVALIAVIGVVVAVEASHKPAHPDTAVLPSDTPSAHPAHSHSRRHHGRPVAVPVLMFHHVAPRAEGSPLLWVTPRQLAAELAWLGHHGYHTVTLAQVYARWTTGSPLPVHPVVLSFDDGYLDQYRYAAPVLRHYRDVAVLNLIVDNLGRALTVADVSRMAAWGWEIDSHTITHRDLALLPARVVRYEPARLAQPTAPLPASADRLLLLSGWRLRCRRRPTGARGGIPRRDLGHLRSGPTGEALHPAPHRRLRRRATPAVRREPRGFGRGWRCDRPGRERRGALSGQCRHPRAARCARGRPR